MKTMLSAFVIAVGSVASFAYHRNQRIQSEKIKILKHRIVTLTLDNYNQKYAIKSLQLQRDIWKERCEQPKE